MINEKNESNNELDKKDESELHHNSNIDESSQSSKEQTSYVEPQLQGSQKPEISSNPTEKRKKNPYKIAFFSLGGIILLGGASYFGYKCYKDHQVAPVLESVCLDTDTKIYDAYKDAVVMVRHSYGYFAKIKGKEVRLDVPEASVETIYGTAFFVDRKGNMISNNHVLQPWNFDEDEKISTNINNFRRKISSILTNDISAEGYGTFIMSHWDSASSDYPDGEDNGDYASADSGEEFVESDAAVAIDSVAATADIAASIPQKDYVSLDDIEVYVKTIDISVALHDSSDEWLSCNIVKVSDDS